MSSNIDKLIHMDIMASMLTDIKDESIVIFGFGAQGRAQALNLKDSGLEPTICLPETSRTIEEVKSHNFKSCTDPVEAARNADIALFLTPDAVQPKLYKEIEDDLHHNATIVFAHGLNIHYKRIQPRSDLDVILVAPMPHGNRVRKMYLNKEGIPIITAVDHDVSETAWQTANDLANAIGAKPETIIKSTFAEETETDLFAEQTLLVGGLKGLITAAFDTLVEAGYSPEIAYYCCLKETEIMSEMFARFGITGTLDRISDTARFGALSRGPRVIDDHVKNNMKNILKEIKDNTFINELGRDKIGKIEKMMEDIRGHKLDILYNKTRMSLRR